MNKDEAFIVTRSVLPGRIAVLALGLPLLLASCSSTADLGVEGVERGVYPDFSKPIASAMPQMSDEEAARMSAQLSALAQQRQSGAISEAEYQRRVREMRALAAVPE